MTVGGTVVDARPVPDAADVGARGRGRWFVALALVAVVAGYAGLRSTVRVEAAGPGWSVEPRGRFEYERLGGDATLVAAYEGLPDVRMRLPVRNPGPLPVTVTYRTNLAPPPAAGWPLATVRIGAGETAELAFAYSAGGCRVERLSDGSWFQVHTVLPVEVRAAGFPLRRVEVPLPHGIDVPGLSVNDGCAPR